MPATGPQAGAGLVGHPWLGLWPAPAPPDAGPVAAGWHWRRKSAAPRPTPRCIDALQSAQRPRERDKLRVELGKPQLVIEVQKKLTALLDRLAADDKRRAH